MLRTISKDVDSVLLLVKLEIEIFDGPLPVDKPLVIEAGENAIEHFAPPSLFQRYGGLCLLEKMVTQTRDVNDIELVFLPLGQWVSGVQDETEGFPLEFGDKHEGNSIGTG